MAAASDGSLASSLTKPPGDLGPPPEPDINGSPTEPLVHATQSVWGHATRTGPAVDRGRRQGDRRPTPRRGRTSRASSEPTTRPRRAPPRRAGRSGAAP